MVKLIGENLKEFMQHAKALVQDLCSAVDVKIVGGAAVVGLQFGMFPEKFRDIEDFSVEIDGRSLDVDLSDLTRDIAARHADLSSLSKVNGQLPGVFYGPIDELFKGGQLGRLGKSIGDGKLGHDVFVVQVNLVLFDLHLGAIGEGVGVDLLSAVGLFFKLFDHGEHFTLFVMAHSPKNGGSKVEKEDVPMEGFVFFDLEVENVTVGLGKDYG